MTELPDYAAAAPVEEITDGVDVVSVRRRHDIHGFRSTAILFHGRDANVAHWVPVTDRMMYACDKLDLHCVDIEDKVRIREDVDGAEITAVSFGPTDRSHTCECSSNLETDGIDVWCPNPFCLLTVLARLNHLANVSFPSSNTDFLDPKDPFSSSKVFDLFERIAQSEKGVSVDIPSRRSAPDEYFPYTLFSNDHSFKIEGTQGRLMPHQKWEELVRRSTFLSSDQWYDYGLANALTPSGFNATIEELLQLGVCKNQLWFLQKNVSRVIEELQNISVGRNVDDNRQNQYLMSFLHALAYRSLNDQDILNICLSEQTSGIEDDPFETLATILTDYESLASLGSLNDRAIREVLAESHSRRHELIEIFNVYCQHNQYQTFNFRR